MTITLNALQKQRRDTASNWTSNNPTLLAGEWGIESDTKKFKIGDGTTAWQSLDYVPIPDTNRLLTGDLTISGSLTVSGTTTTIDTTTLTVEDKNIEIGKVSSPSDTTADGGGITLKGATDKTINWVDSTDSWTLSEHLNLASGKVLKVAGTQILSATQYTGNSATTTALATARAINGVNFDGTAAITVTAAAGTLSGNTLNSGVTASSLTSLGSLTSLTVTGDLTVDTSTLKVDSTNNRVGIGTTSAGGKLAILSNSSSYEGLELQTPSGDGSGEFHIGVHQSGSTAGRSIVFKRGGADGMDTESMRIDSSGKLLVGSTSSVGNAPTQSFSSHGSTAGESGFTSIDTASMATGVGGEISFYGKYDSSGNYAYTGHVRGIKENATSGNTACALTFHTRPTATAPQERMRIDSSGKVGIGTTSPGSVLGVQGAQGFADSASTLATSTSKSAFRVKGANNSSDSLWMGVETSDANPYIQGANGIGNNTKKLLLNPFGGNVGIGTTSPSSRLHVVDSISAGGAGVITATDTSSNDFGVGLAIRKTTTTTSSSQRFIQFFANGVGQPMGGIVGNGAEQAQFLQLSDERCKKNIKPLSGILDKVNKLKTVSFDWKHINENVEAGFIAQNVQELFPEYVIKNIANEGEEEKMGTTGGMTGGFIAVLTAAIQELSAKVEALEAA